MRAFGLLALALVAVGVAALYVGPMRAIVISGESMEPMYESGDLVLTWAADSYAIDDIVLYRVEGGGQVIHRVVDVDGDAYVTRGDNRADIDQWRPTDETIEGRPFLHLPGAGAIVSGLRDPLPFAAVVTAAALLVPSGARRTNRGTSVNDPRTTAHPERRTLENVVAGAVVTVLAAASVGALAWSTPTTEVVDQTFVVGTREIALSYSADNVPSALYPDGTLGPIGPDDEAEPLYRDLLEELRVEVLAPTPEGVEDLEGTWSVEARLRSADGWERAEVLSEPTDIPDDGLEREVVVPVEQLLATADTITAETGSSSAVSIDVVAVVQTTGTAEGAVAFQRRDEAVLTFERNGTVLTPGDERSVAGPIEDVRGVERDRSLPGILSWAGVSEARVLTPVAGALGLVVLALAVRQHRRTTRARSGLDLATEPALDRAADTTAPTEPVLDLRAGTEAAAASRPVIAEHRGPGGEVAVLDGGERSTGAPTVNGAGR